MLVLHDFLQFLLLSSMTLPNTLTGFNQPSIPSIFNQLQRKVKSSLIINDKKSHKSLPFLEFSGLSRPSPLKPISYGSAFLGSTETGKQVHEKSYKQLPSCLNIIIFLIIFPMINKRDRISSFQLKDQVSKTEDSSQGPIMPSEISYHHNPYLLKLVQFEPPNIIFTISIRKISNIANMSTFEQQSQSIGQQSSYSDFSFSRTKKIQRRNNRKKVTKIVHTYCFLIKSSEGKQEAFYYQRLAESSLKEPEALKQLVQRQLRQNNGRIIELAKEKAGLPEGSKAQKTINNELVSTPPLVHFFNPTPYYFIY